MDEHWVDLPEKLARLAELARARGVTTLVLRDPASLTWLLGARVHVPQTLDTACLDVVVDLSSVVPRILIVTNAIEAPRLRDTELEGLDADWLVLPWWEARDGSLPTGQNVASDRPGPAVVALGPEVAALRRTLTARQRDVLRTVCRDSAAAATRTGLRLTPDMTEYAAAGVFAQELLERGLDPIVLMVAGKSRMSAHRHPLPTLAELSGRAMIVCCARREGLVASVTRIVSFAPLTEQEQDDYRRLLEVESVFLDASQPGARLGDAFAAGVAAYQTHGLPADEWHRHHQGGFSGFQPREFPAQHSSRVRIDEGSVLAWNPSAAGWKVEDTVIVAPGGPELLVYDASWPRMDIAGRERPDVLIR
jgi:antitoxin VapB